MKPIRCIDFVTSEDKIIASHHPRAPKWLKDIRSKFHNPDFKGSGNVEWARSEIKRQADLDNHARQLDPNWFIL